MQREGVGEVVGTCATAPVSDAAAVEFPFNAQDSEYLRRRGVPLTVAKAAGLKTIGAETARRMLGHPGQLPSGGLAIPYPAVTPPYTRIRMHSGDVRFRAPVEREVPVYVPFNAPSVSDTTMEVVVVEGPIKALSLAAAGFTTVGLGGTSTTLMVKAQLRALNDSWSALPLSGRKVVILFDAGRAANPNVARDEARLAMALEGAGAIVHVAALPFSERGRDQGPDDFLATQGADALRAILSASVSANPVERAKATCSQGTDAERFTGAAQLLADRTFLAAIHERDVSVELLVAMELKSSGISRSALGEALKGYRVALKKANARGGQKGHEADGETYEVEAGRFVLKTLGQDGQTRTQPICNFEAEIAEDRLVDDGTARVRLLKIAGRTTDGRELPAVEIAPADLERSTWPLEKWGAQANLSAARGMVHHLRAALQKVSEPREVVVHAHTGWAQVDGHWRFLHAGRRASDAGVQVELDGPLARYSLPAPPRDLPGAIGQALSFLRVADERIAFPLLCAAFRAPLQTIRPADFTLFLEGQSGSLKSTLAALAMNFFGAGFDANHLPLDWSATAASIEYRLSVARDVLAVIDDFAPRSSDPHDELRRKADQVLRSIGNQSARSRMRADLTAHPDRVPRAFVIATGEDLPSGESIRARLLPVHVERGMVRLDALTTLQEHRQVFSEVMSAYIGWLLPQHDSLGEAMDRLFERFRQQFAAQGAHLRAPAALAHLAVGAELLARFAAESGAFTAEESSTFIQSACQAFGAMAVDQAQRVVEADGVERFMSTLQSLLAQGRVTVGRNTEHPLSPSPGVEAIGWTDGTYHYLLPQPTFGAVYKSLKDAGEAFPTTAQTLWMRMKSKGLLSSDANHVTTKRTLAGSRQRVLVLESRHLTS